MALELVAALIAAAALGLLAWIVRRWVPAVPKWAISVSAAIGLIGTTLALEYGWFDRVSAELPEGVEVVWKSTEAMPLRPWTYLAPITTRFVAMDLRSMARHPANPDLRLAKLYNFARWRPVEDGLMVIDCAQGRQVLVTSGVEITADGILNGAEWVTAPEGDGFQSAACKAS